MSAVYRAIERALATRTDRLLAVTARVRDELVALGVGAASQYRIVPLGLDLAPLLVAEARRGEVRAELGPGAGPLIGIVARLEFYSPEELTRIVKRSSGLLEMAIEAEGWMQVDELRDRKREGGRKRRPKGRDAGSLGLTDGEVVRITSGAVQLE